MTPLLVALGAAVGAPLRFALGRGLDSPRFPAGTLVANVAGSFLLGLLSALALAAHPMALLGTGFCGGFTTYSAFAVQSHSLTRDQGAGRGAAYAVLTVGLALAACALGFLLAS